MKHTIMLLSFVILLAGCGIKPGSVSAPKDLEKDYFPRTYPDPATDPDPQRYVRP